MYLTAELTMYPLSEEYEAPILSFIGRLRKNEALTVVTNPMSTQVVGPFEQVMQTIQEAMAKHYAEQDKAAIVVKFLPGQLDITQPYELE